MEISNKPHMRSYQACRACRSRKIRCDRGPVDNPDPPPCARCRRESKECVFSSTRRRRRPNSGAIDEEGGDSSDYEAQNQAKRTRSDVDDITHRTFGDGSALQQQAQSAPSSSASAQFGQPLPRRNSRTTPPLDEEDEKKASNKATAMLQTSEVFSGHDALNLLFEAAGRNGDIAHHRSGSGASLPRPSFATTTTPGSYTTLQSPQVNGSSNTPAGGDAAPPPPARPAIDPAIGTNYAAGLNDLEESRTYEDARRAWSKFRFVRAGWFTAREGIAYIDYFYQYLSPLTPIVVQDFQNHSLHGKMLIEEPMLVMTMLTISSRYMKLSGTGATSRPYSIHQQLWRYLLGLVQRVIFSQEQFGGGICGAGASSGPDGNPALRKGLRTLGTVESLLLLTEWHPRALHFPPGDDNDELMVPEDMPSMMENVNMLGEESANFGSATSRVDSCLEPCWRSDRMTWMLLGVSMSLALELGVFDEMNIYEYQEENPTVSLKDIQAMYQRKQNLKELLLIYITQTSGRLGLSTMLPKKYTDPYFSKTPEQRLRERMDRLQDNVLSNGTHEAHKHQLTTRDLVLYFWVEIAALFESGNQRLFQSRKYTRDIITTGRYGELLQYYQPILQQWRRTFEEASVPLLMRHVLMIEYEYSRVYINCLALQAIVERCTNNSPSRTKQASTGDNAQKPDNKAIPFSTLIQWYGDDRNYIAEVTDGARNVLRLVVEGLYPNEYLKHAPVRTYFRIISVAIILLKTFALGATEDDVAISLGLMDRAVEAIRTCIVDDVHVGVRFADLLATLSNRIRSSFVRMSAGGGAGTGMSTSRAQSRSPGLAPLTAGMAPMGPPPAPNSGSTSNTFLQAPQPTSWNNNNASNNNGAGTFPYFSPNSPSLLAGRMTPSHPLYGISTEPYDPGTGNLSIMPPPSFSINANGSGNLFGENTSATGVGGVNMVSTPSGGTGLADDGSGGAGGHVPDWLALPLDPLLNSYGADVTQTTYGPDVGGFDLLDVLLGNNYNSNS